MIQEYFCSNSSGSLLYNYPFLSDRITNCPNGCEDGACLAKNDSIIFSCIDSDNGKNYYEKGTTTGKRENGEFSTSTDKCEGDDNSLLELYCDNGVSKYESYICSYKCENGVCIDDDTTLNIIEEAEPVDIPANDLENKIIYVCKGCALNGKCYPIGYRSENEYCNEGEFFEKQSEGPCSANYECASNVCSGRNECKPSKGIFAKLSYWFKNWFKRSFLTTF
jgi:hypothetical protein